MVDINRSSLLLYGCLIFKCVIVCIVQTRFCLFYSYSIYSLEVLIVCRFNITTHLYHVSEVQVRVHNDDVGILATLE